jgi:hypothetical protein
MDIDPKSNPGAPPPPGAVGEVKSDAGDRKDGKEGNDAKLSGNKHRRDESDAGSSAKKQKMENKQAGDFEVDKKSFLDKQASDTLFLRWTVSFRCALMSVSRSCLDIRPDVPPWSEWRWTRGPIVCYVPLARFTRPPAVRQTGRWISCRLRWTTNITTPKTLTYSPGYVVVLHSPIAFTGDDRRRQQLCLPLVARRDQVERQDGRRC